METTNKDQTLPALTVEGLKAWARANKPLALAVCKVRAFAECERARVDAYVEPIFLSYGFRADAFEDDDGRILTRSKDLYLSKDDEGSARFYAEAARAYVAHGWKGDPEFCPALVAEDLQVKAEQALLDELSVFVGVDSIWTTLESRAKALDLALGACLGGVQ